MHVRPFNERVRWKRAEIARVDLRPLKKKMATSQGRLDWQGWCRGEFKLQLRLIGHCGALWDQQHSSAAQLFSDYATLFRRKTWRISVALVLWAEYRRSNEVILSRGDDWKCSLELQRYKLGETVPTAMVKPVETSLFCPKHTLSHSQCDRAVT